MKTASPKDVKAARLRAGLTQQAAAAVLNSGGRLWRAWESDKGKMPTIKLEVFLIKTRQLWEYNTTKKV